MKRSIFGMRKAARTCGLFVGLGLGLACGSGGDDPGTSSPSPAPQNPQQTPSATTSMTDSAGGSSAASPAATDSPVSSGGSAAASPAASETSSALGDGCAALGSTDQCAACICERCSDTLQTCLETDGCPAILVCVRESGCTGRDCFCGDASLVDCLQGEGDGPCRDAILAAPGGRAPSAQDPSAGPASDAAQQVGDCAEDEDQCSELCVFED